MRVLIAGSRAIDGKEGMKHLEAAIKASGWNITEVVTGGASGVDELADEWAKKNGIDRVVFPANWTGKGKSAGYKRNQKMVWYINLFAKVDTDEEVLDKLQGGCIALWNGTSSGTKHTIDISKENYLPLYIHLVQKKTNKVS